MGKCCCRRDRLKQNPTRPGSVLERTCAAGRRRPSGQVGGPHSSDPSTYRPRNVTLSRALGPPRRLRVGPNPAPWGCVSRRQALSESHSLHPRQAQSCQGLPRPCHTGHLQAAMRGTPPSRSPCDSVRHTPPGGRLRSPPASRLGRGGRTNRLCGSKGANWHLCFFKPGWQSCAEAEYQPHTAAAWHRRGVSGPVLRCGERRPHSTGGAARALGADDLDRNASPSLQYLSDGAGGAVSPGVSLPVEDMQPQRRPPRKAAHRGTARPQSRASAGGGQGGLGCQLVQLRGTDG